MSTSLVSANEKAEKAKAISSFLDSCCSAHCSSIMNERCR